MKIKDLWSGKKERSEQELSNAYVSRFEVIDWRKQAGEMGRRLVILDRDGTKFKVEFSMQDKGKTLKVFLNDK